MFSSRFLKGFKYWWRYSNSFFKADSASFFIEATRNKLDSVSRTSDLSRYSMRSIRRGCSLFVKRKFLLSDHRYSKDVLHYLIWNSCEWREKGFVKHFSSLDYTDYLAKEFRLKYEIKNRGLAWCTPVERAEVRKRFAHIIWHLQIYFLRFFK